MPSFKILTQLFFSIKFLLVFLSSIAILASTHEYNNRGTSKSSNPIVIKTYSPDNYQYGITPPISFGALEDPLNAYINLRLDFYINDLNEYQNIFQTAPGNEGLRLEISGKNAALVLSDKLSSGGIKGLTISSNIYINQWYTLYISAKNGESIFASLDGTKIIDYKSSGIELKGSEVLIGQGFDQTRMFHGRINNITFEDGKYAGRLVNKFNKLKNSIALIGIIILLYCLIGYFDKFRSKCLFKCNSYFTAMITSLITIFFYNYLFFDKYFPLSEGWFSTYSLIIKNGGIPYKDFHFFLTPLYPIQISFFQEIFGNNIYYLRLMGLAISLVSTAFLFLILCSFTAPLIASICTITAMIYYESGVAFINYDFTQFLTLYCLCSIYCFTLIAKNIFSRNINLFVFFGGFFATLAFLTKQSNGGVFLLFTFIALLYLSFVNKNFRQLKAYLLGVSTPLTTTIIYLHINSALPSFWQQVFTGAIQSKGTSLLGILFGWMSRLDLYDFIKTYYYSKILLLFICIMFIINYFLIKFSKRNSITTLNYECIFILLFCSYSFIVIYIALFRGALYEYLKYYSHGNIILFSISNLTLIVFTVCLLFNFIFQIFTTDKTKYNSNFTILFLFLGIILGNGTSAGISEISLFLPFALILGWLMGLPDPIKLIRLSISCGCLFFIFTLADSKFKEPYAWWSTSEPSIYDNSYSPRLPILSKLKLSDKSGSTLEELNNIIVSNSSTSDDVFFFPNISGLYAITGRLPHSKSIVTWFDFLPDKLAVDEANRLLEHPPQIIVNLQLPQNAWDMHETYFRDGEKMGQRKIRDAINNLTTKLNSPYILVYTNQTSPETVIQVWSKK